MDFLNCQPRFPHDDNSSRFLPPSLALGHYTIPCRTESGIREWTRQPDSVIVMKGMIRALLALGVLGGGTGLALLFRLEARETATATSADDLPVVASQQDWPTDTAQGTPVRTAAHGKSANRVARPLAIAAPQESDSNSAEQIEPPPHLAESYSSSRLSSPVAGRRNGLGRNARTTATHLRTHRVVDGDTLQEIARQYLGSASLAGEIFEANRTKLSDPDLLPIGVELTIPSGVRRTGAAPSPTNRRPLVPVAPRGQSAGRDQPERTHQAPS